MFIVLNKEHILFIPLVIYYAPVLEYVAVSWRGLGLEIIQEKIKRPLMSEVCNTGN